MQVINKLEVNTEFDFELITKILTSAPEPCPAKPGFHYVHLILIAETKPLPLLLPYLYPPSPGRVRRVVPLLPVTLPVYISALDRFKANALNDMSEWSFTNNDLVTVRHTREV